MPNERKHEHAIRNLTIDELPAAETPIDPFTMLVIGFVLGYLSRGGA